MEKEEPGDFNVRISVDSFYTPSPGKWFGKIGRLANVPARRPAHKGYNWQLIEGWRQ